MEVTATPPPVAKRYPSLRFLSGLYKFIGALVLVGGIFFGLYQMVAFGGFGVMSGLGTIVSSLLLGGMCGMIAEGVEVFLGIEENTRQASLIAAQAAAAAPSKAAVLQIESSLSTTTRLLAQMLTHQQETNERIEALAAELNTVRGSVGAGVQAMQAIAESSKVTATVLYRNGAKTN